MKAHDDANRSGERAPRDRRPTDALREILRAAEVTQPVTFRDLTVTGIRVPPPLRQDGAGYATLDEAIERGWLEVEEASEGGRVPELRVRHRGGSPVLVAAGGRAQAEEPTAAARRFLALAAEAECSDHPSVAAGVDLRLRGTGLVGAALVHEGRVAHLALFPADRPPSEPW